MKGFFAAMRFLTILPIPDSLSGGEKTLARSISYFPLAGLMIGLIAAAFDYAACRALPLLPASVLTVVILIALTGGLHMDGLADTADGFFSARPREWMMDILRDSRIGVLGVLAVIVLGLLWSLWPLLERRLATSSFIMTIYARMCRYAAWAGLAKPLASTPS